MRFRFLTPLALTLSILLSFGCGRSAVQTRDEDGGTDDASGDLDIITDGPDHEKPCEVNDDCPEGHRCLEGRGVMGWTVTSVHWTGSPIAVDQRGEVYLAGQFQGEIDFDPGLGVDIHHSVGRVGGFVMKLNNWGEYVKTAVLSGTSEIDTLQGLFLALGHDDDVYVGGLVERGAFDVDPGPEVAEISAQEFPGGESIQRLFIVRLASDMTARWVHTFNAWVMHFELAVGMMGINATKSGIVVTGYYNQLYWDDPTSGPGSIDAGNLGSATYVRQITTDGQHLWTAGQSTTFGEEGVVPTGLDVSQSGEVIVAVSYLFGYGSVDFDPGPGEDWRGFDSGPFIWRLGSDGSYLGTIDGIQKFAHIIAHNSGRLLIGGSFSGEIDLDPGPGIDMHQSTDDGQDSYLCMLDTEFGLNWSWVSGLPATDIVTAVASDEQGRIYLAARIWSQIGEESLLVALDQEGDELWRREFPGVVNSMVASTEHGLYLAGVFSHEGDFDPGPGEDIHDPINANDTFVTRLTLGGTY